MNPNKDYYQTLGVKRDATADEVRKAYRRLARKFHPDLNPGDKTSEDRFKQVQEAYDILSDVKKRKMFDQFGFYSESGIPGGGQPPPPGAGFGFGGFDFSEGPGGVGGGPQGGPGGGSFSDLFSQFFGQQKSAHQQGVVEKGTDLEYSLSIDFWQAIRGTQVRLNIHRLDACSLCRGTGHAGGTTANCPHCHGTGNVQQTAGAMKFSLTCPRCGGTGRLRNACQTCRGEGRSQVDETVEVRIPAGSATGSRLRVAGKGNAGSMVRPPAISTSPSASSRMRCSRVRAIFDVRILIPVSVTEAGLGAKIEVPTVDGRALLKIRRERRTARNSPAGKGYFQCPQECTGRPDCGDRHTGARHSRR